MNLGFTVTDYGEVADGSLDGSLNGTIMAHQMPLACAVRHFTEVQNIIIRHDTNGDGVADQVQTIITTVDGMWSLAANDNQRRPTWLAA